jgi:hypothetical protein
MYVRFMIFFIESVYYCFGYRTNITPFTRFDMRQTRPKVDHFHVGIKPSKIKCIHVPVFRRVCKKSDNNNSCFT